MPSTTTYSFAEVVLVRFPFTDQQGSKQRPAVVISSDGYNQNRPDLVLMAITSRIREPRAYGEARVEDWELAGLLKASAIKPVLFTVEKTIIAKTLGQLSMMDQEKLREAIRQVVAA